MAEISGFFNSMMDDAGEYDREYLAETFAAYFASFIGNGVFPNPSTGLQVIASSGMNVILQTGQGWINGYWYHNTDNMMHTLAPASGTTVRIDAIVFGWSASERRIYSYVKQGVPSLAPQKPQPQRDADAHERIVAYVRVDRNIINITQTNIEDTRMDPFLCGIVHGVVDQIDTTTLGIQLQTFINEYMEKYNREHQEFTEFVAGLKSGCNMLFTNFSDGVNALLQSATTDYNTYAGNLSELLEQFRQNATTAYGGFLNFIQVYKSDSTAAYQSFIEQINQYQDEYLTKVQALIASLEGLLDGDIASQLMLMIQQLQSREPVAYIGIIKHNLPHYPQCDLYKVDYAGGVGGAGEGGAGGSDLISLPAEFSLNGSDSVAVKTIPAFSGHTEIYKISNTMYGFAQAGSKTSLLFILR